MTDFESELFSKELDNIINRYGSLVGILLNKNISCVTMFSQLLIDDELKDIFVEVADCSWFDLVLHMTKRYPILHKSKKIKKVIT